VFAVSTCHCRYFLRNAAETQASEVELFLNSVPILNPLSQEEKLQLVDAFEELTYKPGQKVGGVLRHAMLATLAGRLLASDGRSCISRNGSARQCLSCAHAMGKSCVCGHGRRQHPRHVSCLSVSHTLAEHARPAFVPCVHALPSFPALFPCAHALPSWPVQIVIEGEAGDKFYIIKEGEAVVFQTGPDGRQHKVNHLFRADFFGERALLAQEPRMATVSGSLYLPRQLVHLCGCKCAMCHLLVWSSVGAVRKPHSAVASVSLWQDSRVGGGSLNMGAHVQVPHQPCCPARVTHSPSLGFQASRLLYPYSDYASISLHPCALNNKVNVSWYVSLSCVLLGLVQVESATPLTVLALARDTFLSVLGPLEALLTREKSPQVSTHATSAEQPGYAALPRGPHYGFVTARLICVCLC
jgi:hypothetical protein